MAAPRRGRDEDPEEEDPEEEKDWYWEWEVDWNHPALAPLDPMDRLANARRFNWDAPVPMRRVHRRRPASAEEVRRMQFETARRIIFGTRNVNEGGPPGQARERHTSAGTVEWDQISFLTPFQLGNVRLMISAGSDKLARETNPETLASNENLRRYRNAQYISVVWMEMPDPLRNWDARANMTPQNVDMRHGLMVAGAWVCIGVLRVDHFIPMMPNLMHLLEVSLIAMEDRRENDDFQPLIVVGLANGQVEVKVEELVRGYYEAEFDEDAVRARYDGDERGEDEDSADWEERTQQFVDDDRTWLLSQDVNITWEQTVPGEIALITIADNILTLEAHTVDIQDLAENPKRKLHNDAPGEWDIHIDQSGEGARITYMAPVPFDKVVRIFPETAPAEFVSKFARGVGNVNPGDPCAFFFPTHAPDLFALTTRAGRRVFPSTRIETTAWRWEDIALICYAQSYLMHVLTGPDRRHFDPDPADTSPMKETREPLPCFVMRRDPFAGGVLELCLARPAPVPFQSFETALYFFTSSLAWRAARVLDRAEAARAKALGPAYANALQADFQTGQVNPNLFFAVMDIIQQRKERMAKYEFMGCHVCLDKPAAMQANKVPGLRVCSDACYQEYKRAGARNRGE
jgi:hypothetical protein